jgi:hypothetical protein
MDDRTGRELVVTMMMFVRLFGVGLWILECCRCSAPIKHQSRANQKRAKLTVNEECSCESRADFLAHPKTQTSFNLGRNSFDLLNKMSFYLTKIWANPTRSEFFLWRRFGWRERANFDALEQSTYECVLEM